MGKVEHYQNWSDYFKIMLIEIKVDTIFDEINKEEKIWEFELLPKNSHLAQNIEIGDTLVKQDSSDFVTIIKKGAEEAITIQHKSDCD